MRLSLLVVAASFGCGLHDDPVPRTMQDAGLDAAVVEPDAGDEPEDADPAPPAPPALPALPDLGPCPAGWREVADVDDDALVHCSPWPDDAPRECPAGQAQFPGLADCVTIGPACPEGDWDDDGLPQGQPLVFVRPGAKDGTGRREAPYGTLAEAVANAPAGAVVVLAKGTYDEALVVDKDVTLWGACVEQTILASSVPGDDAPTLHLGKHARGVRNLTVAGARTGIEVADADVEIESVVVRDVAGTGLLVAGNATVVARGLVVRDATALDDDDAAIVVRPGATLELERAMLERNAHLGVVVDGGTLSAGDLAVVDTRTLQEKPPYSLVYLGDGLRALAGAQVHLARAAFVRNGRYGLRAAQAGTSLVASDLFVADTVHTASDSGAGGLEAKDGAHVVVSHASFHREKSPVIGLDGAHLVLTDLIVADSLPFGAVSSFDATLDLERAALVRGTTGCSTRGEVHIRDLVVRDMYQATETLPEGSGLLLSGVATVERVSMRGIVSTGLSVAGAGTDVTLRDLTIVMSTFDGARGFGATFIEGAHATVERAVFDNGGAFTVWARSDGTEVALSDVVIRGSRGILGDAGYALMVLTGARVHVARALFDENRQASILAHSGGILTAEDLVVQNTLQAACAAEGCPGLEGGFGVSAQDEGSSVDLRRFLIQGSALCGVQVVRGAGMDLHLGKVRDSPLGANVQGEGFDILRLQDRVRYLEVDRKLDSSELPVPVPPEGI